MHRETTPARQLAALQTEIAAECRPLIVDFEGSEGSDGDFKLRPGVNLLSPEAAPYAIDLARLIVEMEIGSEWNASGGSSGFLRFDSDGTIWLDADSSVMDWTYEREIDIEDILDLSWPEEEVLEAPQVDL